LPTAVSGELPPFGVEEVLVACEHRLSSGLLGPRGGCDRGGNYATTTTTFPNFCAVSAYHHVPESELQRHFQDATAVLAAATLASGESTDDLVSDDFEHLR
jgi:hypothetical protein